MAYKERQGDDVTFEIVEHIGVISELPTGWSRELNIVSWNGSTAKADLRDWDPDHERMSRGITLRKDEAKRLRELLKELLNSANI